MHTPQTQLALDNSLSQTGDRRIVHSLAGYDHARERVGDELASPTSRGQLSHEDASAGIKGTAKDLGIGARGCWGYILRHSFMICALNNRSLLSHLEKRSLYVVLDSVLEECPSEGSTHALRVIGSHYRKSYSLGRQGMDS